MVVATNSEPKRETALTKGQSNPSHKLK